jgi:hypothetical protein
MDGNRAEMDGLVGRIDVKVQYLLCHRLLLFEVHRDFA